MSCGVVRPGAYAQARESVAFRGRQVCRLGVEKSVVGLSPEGRIATRVII